MRKRHTHINMSKEKANNGQKSLASPPPQKKRFRTKKFDRKRAFDFGSVLFYNSCKHLSGHDRFISRLRWSDHAPRFWKWLRVVWVTYWKAMPSNDQRNLMYLGSAEISNSDIVCQKTSAFCLFWFTNICLEACFRCKQIMAGREPYSSGYVRSSNPGTINWMDIFHKDRK